jgi:hypothetical protein
MKPNTRLEPGLVDNASEFSDRFFGRFTLRPAPQPLELAPGLAKTYSFPTFYADVGCAIAIFLCDYRRALALMPHPSLQPVRMPRGRAVVLLSCYQYRKVLGLAPYNEIAMTIPVMAGRPGPPLLPLVMDLEGKGYYVFSMPVTSLENQIRGTRLWGLPKLVEEIDVTVDDERCTTVARDAAGEPYFELSVPTTGGPKRFDECGILYTLREGRLLRSRTCFAGDFQVRTDFSRLWRRGGATGQAVLKLGRSPRAEVLRQLAVEAAPFQLRFCPAMNACFDLPLDERSLF